MSTRRRSPVLWIVLVGLLVLAIVLFSAPRVEGPPYDPRATNATGARALVLLLEELGERVHLAQAVPASPASRVLVLRDDLTSDQRSALLDWVDAGGTLVVADPASALHGGPDLDGGTVADEGGVERGVCTIDALAPAERIASSYVRRYPVVPGTFGCFGDERTAFVLQTPTGRGNVIALGGADVFTNAEIGEADNAVLAAALLATGTSDVVVLERSRAGGGDASLGDLVPAQVKQGLLLGLVAVVLFALWRGRRLGRPVVEPVPVEIAGSELVVAVGDLLQRARQPGRAADLLRRDLRRQLEARFGVPTSPDPAPLISVVAARTGVPAADLTTALAGPLPVDERQLVLLAVAVEDVRRRCLDPTALAPVGSGSFLEPTPAAVADVLRASTLACVPTFSAAPHGPDRPRPVGATSMALPDPSRRPPRQAIVAVRDEVAKVVVGQDGVLTGVVAALLVRGHVLLEGVPGVAKTLLVKTIAAALDLQFKRIQFTPDLMPSDVIGQTILDQSERTPTFRFREGPVFTNLLLADEVNRTPPKTQAALLEAMEERQVSSDGTTRPLPDPFIVIATQNPVEYEGTYPLPEAQLDRFLFKLHVPYPTAEQEQAVLARHHAGLDPHDIRAAGVRPVAGATDLAYARGEVDRIRVEPAVLAYIVAVARATRESPSLTLGVSPRGATMLLHAAKAWAWLAGRDFVTPDEVKAVARPCLRHRVQVRPELELEGTTADGVLDGILATVPTPR